MGTGAIGTSTKGAKTIRANAQTAQICALGGDGKCSFCQRTGLPILPLRYAVIPNIIKGRAGDILGQQATLGAGVVDKRLKSHSYTVRTLRAGFIHVYLGLPGHWQVYATTSDGLLRLLVNPDDPDQKAAREMTAKCKSEGHNIPAAFINIPPRYQANTIRMAFSRDVWSRDVRAKYERSPGNRMQAFDCAALASNPDTVAHAFELSPDAAKLNLLADEYADSPTQAALRRRYDWAESVDTNKNGKQDEGTSAWPSIHGFFPRTGQLAATGKFAADYAAATKRKVAAVVLHDPVGTVEELNHIRLQVVEWRGRYASDPAIARQHLVSQAIQGTRKIYENGALRKTFADHGMVVVDQDTDEARAANPKKTLVPASKVEEVAKKTSHTDYSSVPMDPMSPVIVPQPIETNVWDYSMDQAAGEWARMQGHYSEKRRAEFDVEYKKQVENFRQWLEQYGADYVAWADDPAWKGWFDDYGKTDIEDIVNAIKMSAPILSGGPTDAKSYEIWKRWLEAAPNDPSNPVYVAMFGQAKSIIDYLTPDGLPFDAAPDKSDKLYDTVKGLVGSKEGGALISTVAADSGLMAAIGHIELAIANAVATLGENLTATAQAIALRAQQAALHRYRKTEAVFIKLTMTVGQYFDALKGAGMDAAKAAKAALGKVLEDVTSKGGRKVRALMLAGFLNISDPRVRSIVIEVTMCAVDGIAALRHAVAEARSQAATAARGLSADVLELVGRLRVAGITLSRQVSQEARQLLAGLRLTASQTASLARRLMGDAMRVASAKAELLLAAGSLLFQGWSLMDSLREAKKKIGAEQREAWLAVLSAAVGIAAALAEGAGLALRALAVTGWKTALKVGGVMAAVASAVDSVQAFAAWRRTAAVGDNDAANFYLAAGIAFGGAAVAGLLAVGSMVSSGFAALSLAGPIGWAILLVVIGVGLLFAAMWAEDTPLQIWLDRCVFGNGARKEGQWTDADHAQEMAELNSVVLGAKAEIAFNDDWNEVFTGTDTVNLRFTLPMFNPDASAYSIDVFAVTAGHSMMPIYSRAMKRIGLTSAGPDAAGRYSVVGGSESVKMDGGAQLIAVDIRVNRNVYRSVQARLQYWPDGDDDVALLQLDKVATD